MEYHHCRSGVREVEVEGRGAGIFLGVSDREGSLTEELHGPPLVVKSDNGSVFGAPAMETLLHDFGVLHLFSPPGTPSYNGAIEAGIGSLKARSEAHAARHDSGTA